MDLRLEKLSARLRKKKLLRRTPYAEIGNEYTALMKEMKRHLVDDKESHPYIAICYLAVARCKEALNLTNKSASRVAHAGASLMSHRLTSESSDAVWEDFVPDAIELYCKAARLQRAAGQRCTASALLAELGQALMAIEDRRSEASIYFQESVKELYDPYITSPMLAIKRLNRALECEIAVGEYRKACNVAQWIITLAQDLPDLRSLEQALGAQLYQAAERDPLDGDSERSGAAQASATTTTTSTAAAAAAAAVTGLSMASDNTMPSFPIFAATLLNARITLILLLVLQGAYERATQVVSKLLADHASNALGDEEMLTMNFDLNLDVNATSPSQLISLLHNLVHVCSSRDVQVFIEIQALLVDVASDTHARILDLILKNIRGE